MYLLRIVLFIFGILSGFSYIALSIPQEVSMPPTEEKFDAALVQTKADVVEIGQKIFFGKGQCALCHALGGGTEGRCPNLEGIGSKLTRAFEYETYTDPEAYVYLDYEGHQPKRFAARMPPINKPPIGLTEPEMLTVFAFLQNQAGFVEIEPAEVIVLAGGEGPVMGNTEGGKTVYERLVCVKCHKIGDEAGGEEGPNLVSAVSWKDVPALRRAIFDKKPHEKYDEKMTVREMNDLISYLSGLPAMAGLKPATAALVPEGKGT